MTTSLHPGQTIRIPQSWSISVCGSRSGNRVAQMQQPSRLLNPSIKQQSYVHHMFITYPNRLLPNTSCPLLPPTPLYPLQLYPLGQAVAQVQLGDNSLLNASGENAFLLWRSVYLVKQVSTRTRLLVLFDFVKSKLFGRDLTSL